MPGYKVSGLLWRSPITMEEIKNRIILILTKVLTEKEEEKKLVAKVVAKAVCCACVLVYHECLLTNPNIVLCRELIQLITEKSMHQMPEIHTVALSVLSSLGYLFHIFYKTRQDDYR